MQSIRFKSIVSITVLITLLWGGLLAAVWHFGTATIVRLEAADVARSLDRASVLLEREATILNGTAADWATWDAAHDFVRGENTQGFIAENLGPEAVKALDVDFIVYKDNNGVTVGSSVDSRLAPDGGTPFVNGPHLAGVQESRAVALTRSHGVPASGLHATADGVVVVAAAPVTNSAGTATQAGMVLVGRVLDEERLPELQSLAMVQLDVSGDTGQDAQPDVVAVSPIEGLASQHAIASSGDVVTGYRTVDDLDGNPSIAVRTAQPRELAIVGGTALRTGLLALVLFSVALVVAIALLNERLVLGRLARLKEELRKLGVSHDPSVRLRVSGNDEVADVARGINRMLDDLEGSSNDLAFLANHDSLTRLYNRRHFEAELANRLAAHERGAILWLDLDHFKEINDSLGHAAGDELLRELANLLSESSRGSSLVARLGGDEFCLLLPDANAEQATIAARRLLAVLADHTYCVAQHEVHVSASIGVVTYPAHGSTVGDLLIRADLAMYHSKKQGRNHVSVYSADDSWRSEMSERIAASERIVKSIRAGRMRFFAQPIVSVKTGASQGFELLLRVSDRDGTMLPTLDVIKVAERLGLIRDIDRWAVRSAVRLLAGERTGGRDTVLHVNLSGSAFSDQGVLDTLRDELKRTGVSPDRLVIEIT